MILKYSQPLNGFPSASADIPKAEDYSTVGGMRKMTESSFTKRKNCFSPFTLKFF
jgi:hypothetical protein